MLGKLSSYVTKVSIFLITAALIAGMAGCTSTYIPPPPPSQNLEIRDWYDLDEVRNNVCGNHTLMNDLDSTIPGYEELASPTANGGKGWQPIGTFIPEWGFMRFMGTFDGQGYEIRDLFINRPDEDAVGLFIGLDVIYGDGVIKDIGVVNATVTGKDAVGGLVGSNSGTVSDSYTTGNVTGSSSVGGLAGGNFGTVSDSYFTGSVTGDWWVGGLMGENSHGGSVSNSYSTSNVTGASYVGGLVGYNFLGTVTDSYFTGSVTGEWLVGGLVGYKLRGTVSNSYYNYDEVLINGQNIITVGALLGGDFDQWLADDKFLDVNQRLSQENGYYLIDDVSDFKELLAFGQDSSLKFRLKNDVDLATEPDFYIPYLAGEFDGNGHKISNLKFDFDFVPQVGLFGYLAPGGKVTQVGVENANITGADIVGSLVGESWGTVSDSYSTGSVTGGRWVGGLVGDNREGTVRNSCSSANVVGVGGVGGLVGYTSDSTVSNCYATGSVTGEGQVGGLVGGTWEDTVHDCYSTGSVTGNSSVGGLVGSNCGTVDDSYSTGSVTGEDTIGGLVGCNRDTVTNSYSTGTVAGYSNVGGLVGLNFGIQEGYPAIVSDSYSTGSVTGEDAVGGLVGENRGTVSDSYSTGSVSGNEDVGGLVGRNLAPEYEGTVSDSFWDTQSSGQSTSDGGTSKTTAEMKDISTFSGAAWDITAVADPGTRNPAYTWNIVDEQTCPFLSWQSI